MYGLQIISQMFFLFRIALLYQVGISIIPIFRWNNMTGRGLDKVICSLVSGRGRTRLKSSSDALPASLSIKWLFVKPYALVFVKCRMKGALRVSWLPIHPLMVQTAWVTGNYHHECHHFCFCSNVSVITSDLHYQMNYGGLPKMWKSTHMTI